MAVNYYDDALLEKLTAWTEKTNLHIYGPDDTRRLFAVTADETNDANIKLPILCLRRSGGYEIINHNRRPLTFDGLMVSNEGSWTVTGTVDGQEKLIGAYPNWDSATKHAIQAEQLGYEEVAIACSAGEKAIKLNAVPINIIYQLDIYTRYLKEADEYMRNLIFNIINYPKLYVTIPYNSANIVHNGNIRIDSNVEDNSDIPERLIRGQFTRLSLTITIDDAYLWDAKVRNNIQIDESDVIVINL